MHMPTLFLTPFRGWFFNGSLAAGLLILPWLAFLQGMTLPQPVMGWFWWHQHEMVFAIAVPFLIGFLLTASANWTGERPVNAQQTLLMWGLWWAARVLQFVPVPVTALLLADLLPLLMATVLLTRVLLRNKNYRNLVMSVLLIVIFVAGLMQYLLPSQITVWARLSVLTVILFIVVFGGRVIPFFTANRIGQPKVIPLPWLERSLIIGQIAASLLLPFFSQNPYLKLLSLAVALLHLIRWWRWQHPALWRIPLLWSLHLAYLGIVLGWFSLAWFGLNSQSLHALSIGGIALMLVAFSGRVSLAHAGHPLNPPKAFLWTLVLLIAAWLFRAVLPMLATPKLWMYLAAGSLWAVAFLIFTQAYLRVWFKPRPDGRPE